MKLEKLNVVINIEDDREIRRFKEMGYKEMGYKDAEEKTKAKKKASKK